MEELRARQDLYQGFGNAMGQAFELVGAPLLMGLVGFFLDRWLGFTPVLTIVFALWGLIGGALRAYYAYAEKMRLAQVDKPWSRSDAGNRTGMATND